MGITKTIRSLEKEKRDRDQDVKLLQLELEKKDRYIDSLKSENNDPNIRSRKMNSSMNASVLLQQRKKDRDLDVKVKELESVISDERKHMARLQQLNTQLLSKIKSVSNTEKNSQCESDKYTQVAKSLRIENNNLKIDKKQMLEEYKDLKSQFLEECDENDQLIHKYEALLKSSKLFEENALELYESHQILTEKLMVQMGYK